MYKHVSVSTKIVKSVHLFYQGINDMYAVDSGLHLPSRVAPPLLTDSHFGYEQMLQQSFLRFLSDAKSKKHNSLQLFEALYSELPFLKTPLQKACLRILDDYFKLPLQTYIASQKKGAETDSEVSLFVDLVNAKVGKKDSFVDVWETLNRCFWMSGGVSRLEMMQTSLCANPGVKDALSFAFRILKDSESFERTVTPLTLKVAFGDTFLKGAIVEVLDLFLRFHPIICSDIRLDLTVLGSRPSLDLQQAYLDLITHRVSPAKIDILREYVEGPSFPAETMLKNYDFSLSPIKTGPEVRNDLSRRYPRMMSFLLHIQHETPFKSFDTVLVTLRSFREQLLDAQDTKVIPLFDINPLMTLATCLVLNPKYKPRESDFDWFTSMSLQDQRRLDDVRQNHSSDNQAIADLKKLLKPFFHRTMGVFSPQKTQGMPLFSNWDGPFQYVSLNDEDDVYDDSRAQPFRAFSNAMPVRSEFGFHVSSYSHLDFDLMCRLQPIISQLENFVLETNVPSVSDLSVTDIALGKYTDMAIKLADREERWSAFETTMGKFLGAFISPGVFQTDLTAIDYLRDLSSHFTRDENPSRVFEIFEEIAKTMDFTPHQRGQFQDSMRTVFGQDYRVFESIESMGTIGRDLETVFSDFSEYFDTEFCPHKKHFALSDCLDIFLKMPFRVQKAHAILTHSVLPKTPQDAAIGYAALFILSQHPLNTIHRLSSETTRHPFYRICDALDISSETDLNDRRVSMGRCFADQLLITAMGLTKIEKAAFQKLSAYYQAYGLPALAEDGDLTPGMALQDAEKKAVLNLFASKKESFALLDKLFFYSGCYDCFSQDKSLFSALKKTVTRPYRTIEEDVAKIRDTHLAIYRDALDSLSAESLLTSADRLRVAAELSAVSAEIGRPVTMADTSTSATAAKKSLKMILGKKGNIAFTRDRFAAFLETLDTRLSIQPKAYLQQFTEKTLNIKNDWTQKVNQVGTLTSVITPANLDSRKFGVVRNLEMEKRGLDGVGCQSNVSCVTMAANNQLTELLDETDLVLFAGVRHAIVATPDADPSHILPNGKAISEFTASEIVAYSEANSHIMPGDSHLRLRRLSRSDLAHAQRKLAKHIANYSKAKDLLRSAMLQQIKRSRLDGKSLIEGSTFKVSMVSLSLVTPDSVRPILESRVHPYHERQMLSEQKKALECLMAMPESEKKLLLAEFVNNDGSPIFDADTMLDVSVMTFNFGVNEREYAGRLYQNGMNAEALELLLNEARGQQLQDGDHMLQSLITKVSTYFDAKRQWSLASVQKQFNPYEGPVLVAVLAHALGASVLFNCKSGKDRTGLMDVMVKIFMREIATYPSSNERSSMDDILGYFAKLERAYRDQPSKETQWLLEQQRDNRDMLFRSGNREVQEENTTAWGYKLEGQNTKRMFAVVFGIQNMADVLGFSKLIEA